MTSTEPLPHRPRCPYCLALLDGWTSVDRQWSPPQPDDVSVCLYCAGLIVMGDAGAWRFPTDGEAAEANTDPRVRVARLAVADAMRQR